VCRKVYRSGVSNRKRSELLIKQKTGSIFGLKLNASLAIYRTSEKKTELLYCVKFIAVSSLRYAVATVQEYRLLRALMICGEGCLSPEIKTTFRLYFVHAKQAIPCYQIGVGLRAVLNELPGLMRPCVV
jgi:hypothetical protein